MPCPVCALGHGAPAVALAAPAAVVAAIAAAVDQGQFAHAYVVCSWRHPACVVAAVTAMLLDAYDVYQTRTFVDIHCRWQCPGWS